MSQPDGPDLVGRIARDTAVLVAVLALGAWGVWPGRARVALGVLGGGALIGLSVWAIRGAVDGVLGQPAGATGQRWPGWGVLVKIFTRHAILAAAAYGMMVRLHLDPVGMLVGVTALVAATAVEAIRSGPRPRGPGRGR
ncbi:MAG: hypothetical protein AB7O67_19890 [Vicinamibacterales bacterium]